MREMEDRKDLYYIGELAEYFGVSRDTLRLYDKVGILSPKKDEKNQYRTYSREDFICLDYVMRLRKINMSLEDINMMINDCTIERAEAVMQVQEKILEDKIEELRSLQIMVKDYQKSFSNAIQNMRQISIEESPVFIYSDVKSSMTEVMSNFTALTKTHVPKFTFVADRNHYFTMDFDDPEERKNYLHYAITLVDDENFIEKPDFPHDMFHVIKPGKCVHAILKTYTNRDYSDFFMCRQFILDHDLKLNGDPIFRTLSVRNDKKKSVDYYDFWAPIV